MDPYFRFACPNPLCGKRLKATPEFIGRKARCGCGQSVVVPVPAAEVLSLDDEPAPPVPRRTPKGFTGRPRPSTEAAPPRNWMGSLWPAAAVAVLVATAGGVWLMAKGRDAIPASASVAESSGGYAVKVPVARAEEPARLTVKEAVPSDPVAVAEPPHEVAAAPEPTPAEKPAAKLSAQILGDWKSVTNPGWEVGFSKSGSIALTTPSYWHVTFYSFTSDDTIRYSGPPSPGSFGGPTQEVVKLKLVGDELTMAFERGPTIRMVRVKKS